jgi:hypothetical protein
MNHQGRASSSVIIAAVVLAGTSLVGCSVGGPASESEALDPVPVSGSVTLDGKPLPAVEVRLVADDRTYAFGRTDMAGRYAIQLDPATPGVRPGPKRVEIRRIEGEGGFPAAFPGAEVTAGFILESSDRVIISAPVTDLDFRLVTTPSGS